MEWFIELAQSMLQSGYAAPAIMALLSVLGVRNLPPAAQAAIASFVAKMLSPKVDDGTKPPVVIDGKDGEGDDSDGKTKTREQVFAKWSFLLDYSEGNQLPKCAESLRKMLPCLVTGRETEHDDAS